MPKHFLASFHSLVAGNMASATLTSAVTSIQQLDNIGIQCNAVGGSSPTGTYSVQVSADYAQTGTGAVTKAGNWSEVATASITGDGVTYFDLNQLSAPWIRLVYTKTSGTGTLDVYVTGKQV